jgi:GxxExxY protein
MNVEKEGELRECPDSLCERVIGAAISVHRALGPGMLESAYEKALAFELAGMGIGARTQVEVPLRYKGNDLGVAFRADVIVDDCLLLELKSVSELSDLHMSQIISYLRLLVPYK